ncbi:hypothetical protein BJ742DRAFT_684019 [Cladochytrium replicatum]|nr:hypothetical protein BJ742DRAFT_684019 [Cladochytrium replicatum]
MWAAQLAISILEWTNSDDFFPHLVELIDSKNSLAVVVMPFVVQKALAAEVIRYEVEKPVRSIFSVRISEFFCRAIAGQEDEQAIRCMVEVLVHLRKCNRPGARTPFDNNYWVDVNFFTVSNAAAHIKAWNTALLFYEIGVASQRTFTAERANEYQLLLDIYKNLSDFDGFNGVQIAFRINIAEETEDLLLQHFEHHSRWDKALEFHETRLEQNDSSVRHNLGLMKSMSSMGLNHLVDVHFGNYRTRNSSISKEDVSLASSLQFESRWKMLRLDSSDGCSEATISAIRAARLVCFQNFKRADESNAMLITDLLYPCLLVQEIDEFHKCSSAPKDAQERSYVEQLGIWKDRLENLRSVANFSKFEALLACRTSMIRIMIRKRPTSDYSLLNDALKQGVEQHFLLYAKLARKHREFHLAGVTLQGMASLVGGLTQLSVAAKAERYKSLWGQGEKPIAVRALKALLDPVQNRIHVDGEDDEIIVCTPDSLDRTTRKLHTLLGRWVGDSRLEPPVNVLERYFEVACESNTTGDDVNASSYYHLARYADTGYMDMENNDVDRAIQDILQDKKSELETMRKWIQTAPVDQRLVYEHQMRKLQVQIDIDNAESRRFGEDRKRYLFKAVENYMKSLRAGSKWDVCVFRLCTLWFSNVHVEELQHAIERHVTAIPTSKFLTLIYQLSARLSNEDSSPASEAFQRVLTNLIFKLVCDHPYHSMYQIVALKNGEGAGSAKRSKTANKNQIAASNMFDMLRSTEKLSSIAIGVDRLFEAYIEFAMYIPKARDGRPPPHGVYQIDKKFRIGELAEMVGVPVTTKDIPVSNSCTYSDVPYIVKFKREYRLVGGINLPKIVECQDSTGRMYTQLVKGQDDLRQDAVLLKVFNVVNHLLYKNSETRQRALAIRTYIVVPLSPRAGIVEWVENSTTLTDYLISAHKRHNPTDWTASECRKRMHGEHSSPDSDLSRKIAVFREISSNFKPVLRHFFFEQFLDPLTWFEKRQRFIRSVGCASIAGFAVGLGDRHAANILLDKDSAEVIHIDLGIAFDQGRLLSTPELVPFRLTRDIVDGMGVAGLEGPFQRTCEETLKVLRNDSSIVLAILDVFRYDPLYTWKMYATRTQQMQRKSKDSGSEQRRGTESKHGTGGMAGASGSNREAERALLGVRQKLQDTLSVECKVNELVTTAMDERNLSRMFPGW